MISVTHVRQKEGHRNAAVRAGEAATGELTILHVISAPQDIIPVTYADAAGNVYKSENANVRLTRQADQCAFEIVFSHALPQLSDEEYVEFIKKIRDTIPQKVTVESMQAKPLLLLVIAVSDDGFAEIELVPPSQLVAATEQDAIDSADIRELKSTGIAAGSGYKPGDFIGCADFTVEVQQDRNVLLLTNPVKYAEGQDAVSVERFLPASASRWPFGPRLPFSEHWVLQHEIDREIARPQLNQAIILAYRDKSGHLQQSCLGTTGLDFLEMRDRFDEANLDIEAEGLWIIKNGRIDVGYSGGHYDGDPEYYMEIIGDVSPASADEIAQFCSEADVEDAIKDALSDFMTEDELSVSSVTSIQEWLNKAHDFLASQATATPSR